MAMYNELFTSSRRRTDMTQIFDVFMEIDADFGFQYVYPAGCEDVQAKQFVFPTGSAEDMPARISRFTFIKTDSKARLTYGYCRYTPSRKTVLCFETGFAVDHFFFPALNEIAGIGHDRQLMETYLSRIYAAELPKPGETVTITNRLTFRTPFLVPRVPSPKSRNVQKLAACLPRKILLALYGSLLRERRILLTSTMLSRLSACVQAVAELTFPIHWQHALIPILPTKMITMTCSPSPYIIGLPKQVADVTTLQEVGDVVIVDLDKPEFTSSELDRLPEAAGQFLRKTLQENDAEYPIRFLEATAMIFGQYWKGFANDEPTGQDMWDSDQFHQITGNDYYQSQCLLQFCDERAGFLHRGLRLDDDFERIARSSNTVDFRLELVQLLKKKTETVVEKCSSRLKKTFDQMKRRKTISEPSSIIPPEWPVEKFCDLIDLTSPPVSPFPTTARRQTLPAILDPNTPYYTPTV